MADDPRLTQVLAVWSEVLRVSDVGADDDFFALGGDSLDVVRILRRMEEVLGVMVSAQTFLESRTPRTLTARLDD